MSRVRPLRVLRAVPGLLLVVLFAEVASRVAFRWDFLIRFESGFMTDMLKLHNGRPLFTDPTDLNTSVYAPAQELLTHAVLAPLGLALDVRFCRLVAVAIGIASAAAAARLVAGEGARWLAFAVASLLVFRNFTADAPHPAHLHALHAIAVLVLCERALARGSFAAGLAATVLSALGVFVRLEAALAPLGVACALVSRRWRWWQGAALVLVGFAAWSVTLGALLTSPNARFFVVDVLLVRARDLRLWNLLLFARGYLAVLAVLALPCTLYLRDRGGVAGRRFVRVWSAVGAAEVLPSIAAYAWWVSDVDAFGIVGLWLFLVVWPCLAGRWADERPGVVALGALPLLVAMMAPVRLPPPASLQRYGEELDRVIAEEGKGHGPFLLARGTMPIVHNGFSHVLLDRADAVALSYPDRPEMLLGLEQRVAARRYQHVFDNGVGYGGTGRMARHYREMRVVVARPRLPSTLLDTARDFVLGYHDYAFGYDQAAYDVKLLEPRPWRP